MDDDHLTSVVRRCYCVIPKDRMKARFTDSDNLSFRWVNVDNSLHLVIPDYLRNAPERVLMDITNKIIQKALYDSDKKLTEDSKKWMLTSLSTPENISLFCQRNNLTKISQYNDAIVVTSDGDVVDSSIFFRVVAIPKKIADSPEKDSIIERTYQRMIEKSQEFMEA